MRCHQNILCIACFYIFKKASHPFGHFSEAFHALRCRMMNKILKEMRHFRERMLKAHSLIGSIIHFEKPLVEHDAGASGDDFRCLPCPKQRT